MSDLQTTLKSRRERRADLDFGRRTTATPAPYGTTPAKSRTPSSQLRLAAAATVTTDASSSSSPMSAGKRQDGGSGDGGANGISRGNTAAAAAGAANGGARVVPGAGGSGRSGAAVRGGAIHGALPRSRRGAVRTRVAGAVAGSGGGDRASSVSCSVGVWKPDEGTHDG